MKTSEKPNIEINNLSKKFPGVQALKDVSLKIYPGEVVSIIGQNGAGKSTLMNILGGIIKQDTGEIYVNGAKVNFKNPLDSLKKGIAYIHQELALFNNLTVAENFINNFETTKIFGILNYSKIERLCEEILQKLDSSVKPKMKVGELSVGQKQIVEISRAISSNAKVIIFDEPTASLSLKEKERLFELINYLKLKNYSIIYITHLFEEIFKIGDRAYILRDGTSVGEVNIKDTNIREIVKLMLGQYLEEFESLSTINISDNNNVLILNNISSENGINNISFSLRSGEILGIWGLLGSGRTELLRTILGFDKIINGSINIIDNLCLKPAKKQFSKYFGYVPENRREEGLFMSLSVLNNISIGKIRTLSNKFGFINKKKEKNIVNQKISALDIKISNINQSVENLSGGNQQKVILSRWLLYKPKVLILDDPTKGLDVSAKADVHHIVIDLMKEGVSAIVVSSDIDEILKLSHRILVLYNKQMVQIIERKKASKESLMQAAMGLKVDE